MSFAKTEVVPKTGGDDALVLASDTFKVGETNRFLVRMNHKPLPKTPKASVAEARDAYWVGDWDAVKRIYLNKGTSRQAKDEIRQMMVGETGGQGVLAADHNLAALFYSADELDLTFGSKKADVVGAAVLESARRNPQSGEPIDPALFSQLAKKLEPAVWNDTGKAIGTPKRGLAAQVCKTLWFNGGYDQICELIEAGVDTTLPAQSEAKRGLGVYSDFVMPIQHIIQEQLPEIPKLGTNDAAGWDDRHRKEVEGAKKIFETLDRTGKAATLTAWKDVKGSEMIREFQKSPGTIWGFEEVRLPYVKAAHETSQGKQPLRMMELWDAVGSTLSAEEYSKLLDDPKAVIKRVVNEAVKTVELEIDTKDKYAEVRTDKKQYLKKFREDATKCLEELVAQVPKGHFARLSEDTKGAVRPKAKGRELYERDELSVSDVAGIHSDKFMSTFACKAGLWWAKNEKKPVYYCLDGINMDDVADYKKVKNAAIETFLADGGARNSTKPHREVVTMQELREILKNWDEFKGTVKFVDKGTVLKGKALDDAVAGWKSKMEASNKQAGRAPAPPKAEFAKELAAIDPALMGKLQAVAALDEDETETDKDARDIVRKSGYLVKMANTRPDYALKYIMSKCDVLTQYGLIPPDLPEAAAKLAKLASLDTPVDKRSIDEAGVKLVEQLKLCPSIFRTPLSEALVRHPLILRSSKAKSALKKA